MSHTQTLKFALADDHTLVRNGFMSLLEAMGHTIILEAANGLELIKQLDKASVFPDIFFIDLQMPVLNGYETTIFLKKKWPDAKIIMLSVYDNDLLITKLLQGGISTFLSKNVSNTVLQHAIESVMEESYYYTPQIANILHQQAKNKKHFPDLTGKEIQFLCLCGSDLSYKEIAQKMNVETRTVENYRDSLCAKFNKHSRTGLATFAAASGLINLSTHALLASGLLDTLIQQL